MSGLGQMVAGIAHEINNPINFIQGNIPYLKDCFQNLIDLIRLYQFECLQPKRLYEKVCCCIKVCTDPPRSPLKRGKPDSNPPFSRGLGGSMQYASTLRSTFHTTSNNAIVEMREDIDIDFLFEDVPKVLASIKMGTARVSGIVASLRNYSRLDEAPIKDVDIHEGIESTLLILNYRIKHDIEVIKDYGALPLVRCSPSQLNQVFTNIVANALDAMFDGSSATKQLIITTRTIRSDHIQISLRDTGPGIPPEMKHKIFDPFFITKPVGKGTGLGLGICFKIIEQHRGKIDVATVVGSGTEFIITLPVKTTQ